uniref:Complementary sex determination N-terminal domain-containing protein n=1 Tax=Clastoptera arizonana TaxID=38151 RepID=A0A1B6CLL0_9HEMI
MSASRSLHRRSPPSPPMISSRPTIRSRMRSPERRRPIDSGSPRSRRPTDLRFPPARRSRSPVGKPRSLSPPIKRNMSPKIIPEVSRRVPPGPVRKSRSRSPMGLSRLPEYKISGSSVQGSSEKFRGNSIERDRILFRGPEGSINYDIKELKKIAVEIRRTPGRGPETVQISRAVTNVEDIVSARRTGEDDSNFMSSIQVKVAAQFM